MQCPFLNGKIRSKFIVKKIILAVIEKKKKNCKTTQSSAQPAKSVKKSYNDGEGSLGKAISGVAEFAS